MACSAWADRLQRPHAAMEAAQGTQTPGFWPGTQTCHQPSPWCSPRTLLPNLTCQVAWSGGQPVPPSPAHDACPGWFLRLSCVSSSGPHIQGLTRP